MAVISIKNCHKANRLLTVPFYIRIITDLKQFVNTLTL